MMHNLGLLSLVLVAYVHSAVSLDTSYVQDIVKILSNVDLPQNEHICSKQVILLVEDVINNGISSWGFRMIDSWSRFPPSGLLSLNLGELGMFDQCINIDATAAGSQVRGKYCLGTVGLGSTNTSSQNVTDFMYTQIQRQHKLRQYRGDDSSTTSAGLPFALCLPNSCSRESIQAVGDVILAVLLGSAIGVTYNTCQDIYDVNPELNIGAIITICFFALLTAVMVLSSAYDYYCQSKKMQPKSVLLVAFSVYTNFQKLFQVNTSATEVSCLNGIRVLSMFWVMLFHLTMTYAETPSHNLADMLKWADQWHSMFLINGSLGVDAFFVVGGMLVVYVFMKAVHNNVKFNLFLFYLHRYLRLTPPLAASVLVNATILTYFGSGPLWNRLNTDRRDTCKTNWWSTILYVQNYIVASKENCVGESWYLDIDMQIYVVSPIFLYVLTKSKKYGSILLSLMIIVFMIVPFCVTWIYELSGIPINFNKNLADYQLKYYYKTHTRAAPWFIGALTGLLISEIKFEGKIIKINKILNITIWLVVFVLMPAIVLAGHDTLRGVEYDKWGNALYNTFIRPTWGLCVAWVIFACVTGHGGFVNRILSLPIFQVMNRFSYSMYLIHLSLIYMVNYSLKTGFYFSVFNIFYTFWGVFMFSFILSIFWVLAFESPTVIIEKVLLGKHR